MKILNQDYFKCEMCGKEAHGMLEINQAFGYIINKEVMYPESICKECQRERHPNKRMKTKEYKDKEWATASYWGRKIHINKRIFNSYLRDIGYLEWIQSDELSKSDKHDGTKAVYGKKMRLTQEGLKHCKEKRVFLFWQVLWSFDTYLEVAMSRVRNADIHDICPKCKAFLDTVPGYNHLDYSHKCSRCGRICEEWEVSANYDR